MSSFQSGRWTLWTFKVPDGAQILKVTFDARLEPAVPVGSRFDSQGGGGWGGDGHGRVQDMWVMP